MADMLSFLAPSAAPPSYCAEMPQGTQKHTIRHASGFEKNGIPSGSWRLRKSWQKEATPADLTHAMTDIYSAKDMTGGVRANSTRLTTPIWKPAKYGHLYRGLKDSWKETQMDFLGAYVMQVA